MTGFMIYMPLYYQVVHKLTPTQAGLALIPVIVMTTPGSMMSGRAMMYLHHYKLVGLFRHVARDARGGGAGGVAGDAAAVGHPRDARDRLRRRHRVSDRDGVDPERGVRATRSAPRPAR